VPGMLAGKRVLVTGVTTHRSIGFAIAREAQDQGAEIALTTFGPRRPITERAARRLDEMPPVLELDVRAQGDVETLAGELERRWGRLDGLVHSIAFGAPGAMDDDFLATGAGVALETFETSAVSLHTLASTLVPLMERAERGSIVALDFDAAVAWPGYNWMGVAKAGLESIGRYLALELGPRGIRVNLISAGPLDTPAAHGFRGFSRGAEQWPEKAPLGWDVNDPSGVAGGACFFLSDWSRHVSGEILHVDGGRHAIG
jgi:meromycolic acid enoyl-[acyl-carrier-protein] reductase